MGQLIRLEKPKLILTKRKKTKTPPIIGVIVQARMTSKRFPGKSIALIDGVTVLERVLQRCLHIKGAKTVLAVPDSPLSEPLLEISDRMGIESSLGSEFNVLARYYNTAKFFGFQHIVRITADCPFIDPVVCMDCINLHLFRHLDYCSNVYPTRTFPMGLDCEVFSFDCLEAAKLNAQSPYELEHVTPWMQKTDGLRRANVQQKIDKSSENWCVDVPEDIERIETLIREAKENERKSKTMES